MWRLPTTLRIAAGQPDAPRCPIQRSQRGRLRDFAIAAAQEPGCLERAGLVVPRGCSANAVTYRCRSTGRC